MDVNTVGVENLLPEATEVSLAAAKISEPGMKREVTDETLILMKKLTK